MSHPEHPVDRPGEARPAVDPPATPQPDPTAAGGGTDPDRVWSAAHDTPTGHNPAVAQAYAQTHAAGHDTPGYGTPGHDTPGHGTPGYETPGHGTPGYGTPGHDTPGHGTAGYGTPGYGTPGYGTPGYGTPGYGHAARGHGWAGYGGQQPAPSPYGYGQSSYPAYSFAYAPSPRTNGLAVASMSVSVSALVLMLCTNGLSGFLGLVGAILGHVSRHQIRERGEAGGGMALAGVIVGWVGAGLAVLALAALVFFVVNSLDEPAGPYTT